MTQPYIALWDPLVRLFHWSIAGVFIANYFVNEAGEQWHEYLGYFAGVWVLVRFVWGFVGKGAARWSEFFPTWSRLRFHVYALVRREPYHPMGHSPLGALVMILMMVLILLLGISGFMMEEVDYFWGEDWVQDLHAQCARVLWGLIIIHVAAALIESYRAKENLPLSMVTGLRKKRD